MCQVLEYDSRGRECVGPWGKGVGCQGVRLRGASGVRHTDEKGEDAPSLQGERRRRLQAAYRARRQG